LALAAGFPLLVLSVAVVAAFTADNTQSLGPLDHAQIQALLLPLFLAVPSVTVATARSSRDSRTAGLAMVIVAIAVALTFAYLVGTTTPDLFCSPVSPPVGLAFGMGIGTIMGIGFYLGSAAETRIASRRGEMGRVAGPAVAAAVFAGAALVGFAVIVAAHPLRCALPG
jgi:hypothetical protein